jgi:hypothetical protein
MSYSHIYVKLRVLDFLSLEPDHSSYNESLCSLIINEHDGSEKKQEYVERAW